MTFGVCAFAPEQTISVRTRIGRNNIILPPLKSMGELAGGIITNLVPPMKSVDQSASDIISSITRTEDLTAIEAVFPFINHMMLSPMQVRELIQILTHQNSKLLRMVICAVVGYFITHVGQFCRNFLSKGKIGRVLRIEQLESSGYKKTKAYHIFNHARQGLYLGAINDAIDYFLDSTVALGVNPKLSTILSNACTSTSFSIWAMFRVRCYKNILIDFFTRKKKKSDIRISIMKQVTNYLLYVYTDVIIMDQIGIPYSIALKGLSFFGGVGK